MPAPDPYRLPRTVVPSRYDLALEPDLPGATFAGDVSIAVSVTEPTAEIVLNAIELEIDEAWVTAGTDRIDASVSLDEKTERATLVLGTRVPAGDATVHVRFRGILNDKLHGFYRSTFTADGASHVIATTQFEATDARRAFPCWDEPDLKAVFAITLDIDDALLAVSNAAEMSSEALDGGRRRVRFADTMVMSTYLVAFVVGFLEATEAVDVDGTPLRVVHPPGQAHLSAFALESGAFALRHFADYFARPYPGDKLDLVAIPDFAFGAMENLGCVTFREALLMIDPDRATQAELMRVADVIHHEIAHMWFGDLVTMRWWNGIWLNEAFATFMEMRCTDAFRPDWDRWTDFGLARTAAYDTDALSTTRPIEFEVVSPVDAEGMFDILTYEKGAAVVRMLEQFLGADRFRDGIRLYMDTHAYGNTDTTDLWDAIEESTGDPVRRIMDSWIFQGGHPELAVSLGDQGCTVHIAQTPFANADGGDDGGVDGGDRRWSVPLLVRWGTDPAGTDPDASSTSLERVLVEGDSAEISLDAPAEWVLANSGGSGFLRVRYGVAERDALTRRLGELTPLERFGLVDDAWAALLADKLEPTALTALLRAFADEGDLAVWQRVTGVLAWLDRMTDDSDRPALQRFVRGLVGPALRRLGSTPLPDEPGRNAALRAALFTAAGVIGADTEIVAEAARLHQQATDGEAVDADLLDAAVRVLAVTADPARFDNFRERASTGSTPQETLRYLGALADVGDGDLMDVFLGATLTDEIRSQDAPFLLRRAITNRAQANRVWAFVSAHWGEINERFPSNSIARLLEGVRTFTDPALAAEADSFMAEHPVPQGAQTVAQHRERMLVSVALRGRVERRLGEALA